MSKINHTGAELVSVDRYVECCSCRERVRPRAWHIAIGEMRICLDCIVLISVEALRMFLGGRKRG